MSHILIVEDEIHLAELERDYLQQAGFTVTLQHRGDDASDWLTRNTPDLIVLDIMLPGKDGLDLCREVRRAGETPVIMTTAKVEEIDRLLGLELGADDYLCKPFSLRELVARVKAILRRSHPLPAAPNDSAPRLTLHEGNTQVCFGEHCVELTLVELNLLQLLMAQPGRIYSREQIIDRIYDDRRVVSDRTVDSHVKKLRKKLLQLNPQHDYIHSVYGAGYRFDLP